MHSLFKGNRLLFSEPTEGWRHFLETTETADSPDLSASQDPPLMRWAGPIHRKARPDEPVP